MSDDLDLAPLFSPYAIRGLSLRNRFVMPAMQRGWCDAGKPTPRMVDYYRRRAAGGVGLIIGESGAVDHPSSTCEPSAAHVYGPALEGWAACIAAASAEGTPMFLQLWHEGAVRKSHEGGYPSLSPSGLVQKGKPNGRAATEEELEQIRDAFVRGAVAAQEVGAAGVEVHAAHGYGLDLFLWDETNLRTDGCGGETIEARLRYPADIVRAIRAAVGSDFVISLRFSQWKEVDFDARIVRSPVELGTLLTMLRAAGVDIFHPSTRYFSKPEWEGSPLGLAGWCKSMTDATVLTVGSVGLDRDIMTTMFENSEAVNTGQAGLAELLRRFNGGEFDLVAIGRGLIGDPDWVQKLAAGRFDELRMFTRQDLFGEIEWDMSFVAEAHKLEQGEGVLLGRGAD